MIGLMSKCAFVEQCNDPGMFRLQLKMGPVSAIDCCLVKGCQTVLKLMAKLTA